MEGPIDQMLIQTVVLLERQFLLTEHLINSGQTALRALETDVLSNRHDLVPVLNVFNYGFALIDHLVRYQKIAFSLPRFNHKSPEFRALDKAMGDLKDVRNQLQHLNNDILNDFKGPLLGAICWVSGTKSFMTTFHDLGRQRSSPGLIFDTAQGKYAHEFCYVYNERYHNLGHAIDGMETFNAYISGVVKIQVDGLSRTIQDHYAAIALELKPLAEEVP